MSNNLKLSIEILKRIPKTHYISAPQLHEQLEGVGYARSLRSIERHLVSISDEFEIERDTRSKPYGYKWKSHAKGLDLPSMSVEESLLLALSEKQLNNLLPEKLMKSLSGYFQQARSILMDNTDGGRNTTKAWLKKVDVVSPVQPLIAPDINREVMVTVSNALLENNWLELKYKNAEGYEQDCRVMPLALVQQDVRLYLVCRFDGYDNERNLAIHRIGKARSQTLSFKSPADFDLKKYIAQGRFGVSDGESIRLTFKVLKDSGKHLLETPLSKDQQVIEKGEYLEISATVINSEVLDRWLNGFGGSIKSIKKTPAKGAGQ